MLAASSQPQDVGGYDSFLPDSYAKQREVEPQSSSPPSDSTVVGYVLSNDIGSDGDVVGQGQHGSLNAVNEGARRGSKRVRTEKLVAQNCAAQRRYRERKKEKEQELTNRIQVLQMERDAALQRADEAERKLREQVGGGAVVSYEPDLLDDILGPGQEQLDSFLPSINMSYQWTNQQMVEERVGLAGDSGKAKSSTCGFTYGLTDVTGYNVRADPKLQVLVETLQQLTESVEIAGKDLKLLWANQSFLDINGYGLHEVIGRAPKDLVRSELNPHSFWVGLCKVISNGQVFKGQMYRKRKDGRDYLCQVKAFRVRHNIDSCFFVMIISPVLMADGTPFQYSSTIPTRTDDPSVCGMCPDNSHASCSRTRLRAS